MSDCWDIVVVGAGAAGLLAATRAAEAGRRVLLLEKNARAGVKILMSGGTRCNLTHDADSRGILDAFQRKQGHFLRAALAHLSPQDLIELFGHEGVATKVEETGKVFPVSNKASDVLDALLRMLRRSGATLSLVEPATEITRHERGFTIQTNHRRIETERLLLTTGGASYPGSGTSGDAYPWVQTLGHDLVEPRPALTPIAIQEQWAKDLRGVTIPDVGLTVWDPNAEDPAKKKKKRKPLEQRRGSLLLAHFGLSGPVALDASRAVALHDKPQSLTIRADFLPAVSEDFLREEIQRLAATEGARPVANTVAEQLPRRLVESLMTTANIPVDRRGSELTRPERNQLVEVLKRTSWHANGTLGFKKAEVTAGGVPLAQVDPRTMESRCAPGLFIAGELLDLDGPIGGYNFQAAFSTGALAAKAMSEL